jgi:hypothetical protein
MIGTIRNAKGRKHRKENNVSRVVAVLVPLVLVWAAPVCAQDPPPRIPIFVVDVQGNVPRFPQDPLLADSRGLTVTDLPGSGLGGQLGAHVHLFKFKAITVGVGGQATLTRAKRTPPAEARNLKAVTEKFRSLGAQLSLNFGAGTGWSYLSGGIGRSNWSIVPEGREPLEGDGESLKTINYGGGARWFAKSHLAFSFDVRLYAINPGVSSLPGKDGSPRTTFMVIGAGVSLK